MSAGVTSIGQGRWSVLPTQILLASKLRISGTLLLLPLYAFMVWTGTNFPFCLIFRIDTHLHFIIHFDYLEKLTEEFIGLFPVNAYT